MFYSPVESNKSVADKLSNVPVSITLFGSLIQKSRINLLESIFRHKMIYRDLHTVCHGPPVVKNKNLFSYFEIAIV